MVNQNQKDVNLALKLYCDGPKAAREVTPAEKKQKKDRNKASEFLKQFFMDNPNITHLQYQNEYVFPVKKKQPMKMSYDLNVRLFYDFCSKPEHNGGESVGPEEKARRFGKFTREACLYLGETTISLKKSKKKPIQAIQLDNLYMASAAASAP